MTMVGMGCTLGRKYGSRSGLVNGERLGSTVSAGRMVGSTSGSVAGAAQLVAGQYSTPLNGARSHRTSPAGPLLSTCVAVAVPNTLPQPL
jgi:hypothetical protein